MVTNVKRPDRAQRTQRKGLDWWGEAPERVRRLSRAVEVLVDAGLLRRCARRAVGRDSNHGSDFASQSSARILQLVLATSDESVRLLA
jgi:hypothetical protein